MDNYKFVINLDDHEGSGILTKYRYAENGEIEEEMSAVQDGEGAHLLYNCTDTVMNKVPSIKTHDEASAMMHEHRRGYEIFFIDSGNMHLYIDGVRTVVATGDILQLQPSQPHAMASSEDVKFRGFFHDLDSFASSIQTQKLVEFWPEAGEDPDFRAMSMGKDHIKHERPYYIEAPSTQVHAVKNPNRPMQSYELEGATVKIIVPRWEDGGVCECICVDMEPGFTATWKKYPQNRELFYVRNGKVKFTICGKEFIATKGCIVNVPRFADHSLVALEKSEVYEIHAQTYWFSFLQNYESIRKQFPERLENPETLVELKAKFGCEIDSIGMTSI